MWLAAHMQAVKYSFCIRAGFGWLGRPQLRPLSVAAPRSTQVLQSRPPSPRRAAPALAAIGRRWFADGPGGRHSPPQLPPPGLASLHEGFALEALSTERRPKKNAMQNALGHPRRDAPTTPVALKPIATRSSMGGPQKSQQTWQPRVKQPLQ